MNPPPADSDEHAGTRTVSWQAIASVVIVVFAATLSILSAIAVQRFEERQLRALIERRGETIKSFLSEQLSPVGRSIAAFQILFENSERVSRGEFESAARTLMEENPEIGLIQWVPVVRAEERLEFIAQIRGEFARDFEIVDVSSSGERRPAPARPESWPIAYIHPLAGNEPAWGFDLVAGPTRKTLVAARDSNSLTMAPPRKLVQDPDGGPALFFVQPVFRPDTPGNRVLHGFVQGISRAQVALRPVIELADSNSMLFELSDITDGESEPFMSTMQGRISARGAKFTEEHLFNRFGRNMRFRSAPNDELLATQATRFSQATLFGGLLATAVLGLYLQGILRRTATITNLVEDKTGELTESNKRLVREAEQRRQAEIAALSAQENFRFIVDSVEGIVWQVDTTRNRIVFVNRRAQEMLGYPAEMWLGQHDFWMNHVHPDDRERANLEFRAGVERGGAFEHSYRMLAADGRTVWLNDYVRIAHLAGQPRLAHVISFDITRQRDAEELLERDAHFLSNVDDALVVCDLAGNITFWNHGAEKIFGWTQAEVLGKSFQSLFNPVVAAAIKRNFAAVANGDQWSGEWTDRRKDTSRVTLDSRVSRYLDREGKPAGIFTISRDITSRKAQDKERLALEDKLQHMQKLESLGVLAGGIAHDFNNLLTGILGHSSLLAMDLPDNDPMAASVTAIEQSALRASALCQQMLAYAGRGKFVIGPVNLGELVRDTSKLIETSIAKETRIEFNLRDDIPTVRADSTQLRQVVMNLVINAVESLGADGGRVAVSTGVLHASRAMLDAAVLGHERAAGTYVFLEVSDTGCGIQPDHMRKIFEPFFSTKFTGRGLGLAAVLGIVRSHDGSLSVSSSPGSGTTFRILLPPSTERAPDRVEEPGTPPVASAGTVLVIDDERFVREAAVSILGRSGCTIESASGGQEGISIFESNPDRYDVVLLDLTMPGMHGVEVLTHIRAIRPKQPVIVMSGFTADEAAHRFDHDLPNAFLEKPFRAANLLSMIDGFVSNRRAR